ncbi:MAG: DUF501 domain-containing protein [Planctomycetota bacterium]|jgi:hypothetical protein
MRQRRFRDLKTEDLVAADDGRVLVRRCYPIRWIDERPTPFPTLYWLADEDLVKRISHVEREGWIKRFEARIAADPELAGAYRSDHESYIEDRWALLTEEDRPHAERLGLRERGIGGLLDFGKIKCLHLQYAHHLARSNTVGELMEAEGLIERP